MFTCQEILLPFPIFGNAKNADFFLLFWARILGRTIFFQGWTDSFNGQHPSLAAEESQQLQGIHFEQSYNQSRFLDAVLWVEGCFFCCHHAYSFCGRL